MPGGPIHQYSNKAENLPQLQYVGGLSGGRRAKLLVWLNTEDLESATLIWEIAFD